MSAPFDAVLLVAFGGPQGPDDVRPFLANVLRGRRVAPERVEEVVHHYERFGGVSPLTELTLRQARDLETRLQARNVPLPVHVGMRNWHPFLAEALTMMSAQGVRRAVGVLASAQRSYSGCLQYKENVRDARAEIVPRTSTGNVDVTYVRDWNEHPGFIEANADHVRDAFARLPAAVRDDARLVFTAHSIPVSMAARYPYEQQLRASAKLVADADGPRIRGSNRTSATTSGASTQRVCVQSCSAPSAFSAIMSKCCSTSTSRSPNCVARSTSRWRAPRR